MIIVHYWSNSKYLNDVLHVSIDKNAIYSSVPKVLSIIVSTGSGFLGDLMLSKWHVDRTIVRKIFVVLSKFFLVVHLFYCVISFAIFQFISFSKLIWNMFVASIIPATFLMSASYAGCDEILAVVLLSVSISAHGFNSAGAAINLFDLSPNYAAPLNAVINIFGTIVGMSAPYIAGLLTPNVSHTTFTMISKLILWPVFSLDQQALLSEWRLVFWITFALHLLESVVFITFGSAVTQSWNGAIPRVWRVKFNVVMKLL